MSLGCSALPLTTAAVLLLPGNATPDPGKPPFRLMFWNPAGEAMAGMELRLAAHAPLDVLVLSNPPRGTPWPAIREQVLEGDPLGSFASRGRIAILSRRPILCWGWTTLGITGAKARTFRWPGGGMVSRDSGEAFFAEIDTRAERGQTTVVWVLDLPSDPDIPRERMLSEAAAGIAAFRGPILRRTPQGRDEPDPATADIAFPRPDFIVGDFNTPRGSRSLRHITAGLKHARAGAGFGACATWPRATPLFSIDHIFHAPAWEALRYRAFDMEGGGHRAVVGTFQMSK